MQTTLKAAWLLAVAGVTLGGCAVAPTSPTAPQTVPAQFSGLQRKPNATAADVAGTWLGTYTCGQGLARLKLTLTPVTASALDGVFEFATLQQPGDGAQGVFRMSGEILAGQVMLNAGPWIRQPPGYITVGLHGWLFANPTRLAGRVLGPGCRTFDLERVATNPAGALPAAPR